jgi:uncharacterized protein
MRERPPLPPFTTAKDAEQKVRLAEDAWNTRDPDLVAAAYTSDCTWRNRIEVSKGREAITEFLVRKWSVEHEYRLIKELWVYNGNRMAVQFVYEWHDVGDVWFRSHGNELWEFDEHGLMQRRIVSINDLVITEGERRFNWPLGRRPDDHPGLAHLGF